MHKQAIDSTHGHTKYTTEKLSISESGLLLCQLHVLCVQLVCVRERVKENVRAFGVLLRAVLRHCLCVPQNVLAARFADFGHVHAHECWIVPLLPLEEFVRILTIAT